MEFKSHFIYLRRVSNISKQFQCLVFLLIVFFNNVFSQTKVSTADYDFYLKDTLLLDVSQISLLNKTIQKSLTFKLKTDGFKTYYYISGCRNSEGLTLKKLKEGIWTNWYDSLGKSSEIIYLNGIRNGKCTYWYKNGQLNALGQYKDDLKEGEWLFYNLDGSFKGSYSYSRGILTK